MIGSAANSGQPMLAGLRVGAPAKATGDAVAGAFDAVVAGLGVPADTNTGPGEAASVLPGAPAVVAPTAPPIDPVAAADVIQGLVAPPVSPTRLPVPAGDGTSPAPMAEPMAMAVIETAATVPDVQAAKPASPTPQAAPALPTLTPALPIGIVAEPAAAAAIPVLISVASASTPVVPSPMAPPSAMPLADASGTAGLPVPAPMIRVSPDEAAVATNAGDGGETVPADGETVADAVVTDPVTTPAPVAPTIIYAPWIAPPSRPAPVRFADIVSADSSPAPHGPDVVPVLPQAAPTVAPGSPLFVQADLSPAARPFVVADLFAPSGDVASAGRAESSTIDLSAVPVPVAARFTPLAPTVSPGFTPLVAPADIPVDDVAAPADGMVIGDDATATVTAPSTGQAADIAAPLAATVQPLPTAPGTAQPTSSIAGPDVAQVVAGHQLDLARDSEWLDQLARDIVAAGASDAKLSFRLNPEHLGSLHVEILRGDDGASVRLTTENEGARAALADAQGRLVAEARAHGMKIAETHVDLGNQGSGHGQRGGADGQSGQPYTPPQPARVNAPVTMIALDDDLADARTGPRERYA